MAPLSLGRVYWQSHGGGRTRRHVCYYTTELLVLPLEFASMWQDGIQATLLLEIATKPGRGIKGWQRFIFFTRRGRGGTNEISLFYRLMTTDQDFTICLGCQEAPS